MITRVGGPRSRAASTRRVASMPSSSGMRMSISTTSGFSRRAMSTACSAVDGLADHLDVVLGVEDHLEAGADERLVVGDHDAHAHALASSGSRGAAAASAASASPWSGSRASTSNPPPARGPASQLTTDHAHALAHADEPVAAALDARPRQCRRRGRRRSARSSSSPRAHAHLGVAAAVLERVGQRLLHDAVGGEVDAGRQLARLAVDVAARPGARPRGCARSARRARCSVGCGASAAASSPACSTPSRWRISASASRPVRSISAAASIARCGSRARMRRAPPAWMTIVETRVGEDVVHLARDPPALLGDRARGVGLALLVGDLRGLVQLGGQLGARAHDAPGQPHQHAEDGREDDVAGDVAVDARERDGDDRDEPRSAARRARARRRRSAPTMKGNSSSPKNSPPISSGGVSHAARRRSRRPTRARARRPGACGGHTRRAPELPPAISAVSHAGPTRWSVVVGADRGPDPRTAARARQSNTRGSTRRSHLTSSPPPGAGPPRASRRPRPRRP